MEEFIKHHAAWRCFTWVGGFGAESPKGTTLWSSRPAVRKLAPKPSPNPVPEHCPGTFPEPVVRKPPRHRPGTYIGKDPIAKAVGEKTVLPQLCDNAAVASLSSKMLFQKNPLSYMLQTAYHCRIRPSLRSPAAKERGVQPGNPGFLLHNSKLALRSKNSHEEVCLFVQWHVIEIILMPCIRKELKRITRHAQGCV